MNPFPPAQKISLNQVIAGQILAAHRYELGVEISHREQTMRDIVDMRVTKLFVAASVLLIQHLYQKQVLKPQVLPSSEIFLILCSIRLGEGHICV